MATDDGVLVPESLPESRQYRQAHLPECVRHSVPLRRLVPTGRDVEKSRRRGVNVRAHARDHVSDSVLDVRIEIWFGECLQECRQGADDDDKKQDRDRGEASADGRTSPG